MLRFEDDSAFLPARARRNGRHVDFYIYDLYLRLNARRAELVPLDNIELIPASAFQTWTQLVLSTTVGDPKLTVEKHGKLMQLRLPNNLEPNCDINDRE